MATDVQDAPRVGDVGTNDMPPLRHIYPAPWDVAYCGQRRENDPNYEGEIAVRSDVQRARTCKACRARFDAEGW